MHIIVGLFCIAPSNAMAIPINGSHRFRSYSPCFIFMIVLNIGLFFSLLLSISAVIALSTIGIAIVAALSGS